MTRLPAWLERAADAAADRLLAWTAAHTGPVEREWLEALRGELARLDSGPSRLAWALGGPRLAWTFTWRRQMLGELRRASLGVGLAIGMLTLVAAVCLRGIGVTLGAGLVLGGLAVVVASMRVRRAWLRPTQWQRHALLAPVVAIGALFAVGASAAGSAAAQTDTQCTTAHPAESVPPVSLVTAQDYLALGDYDYERGDCEKAIDDYSHALAIDPGFAAAYNNRAYTAMRRQDYAAALVDLDRAIDLRPDYVAALMNRGDIYNYYYAIDRQRAVADYDRVIAAGGRRATSVCGHRLLATHGGWSPGVLADLLTQGVDAGCTGAQHSPSS